MRTRAMGFAFTHGGDGTTAVNLLCGGQYGIRKWCISLSYVWRRGAPRPRYRFRKVEAESFFEQLLLERQIVFDDPVMDVAHTRRNYGDGSSSGFGQFSMRRPACVADAGCRSNPFPLKASTILLSFPYFGAYL